MLVRLRMCVFFCTFAPTFWGNGKVKTENGKVKTER